MLVTLHRTVLATDDSSRTLMPATEVTIPVAKIGIMEPLFFDSVPLLVRKQRGRVKLYREGELERTPETQWLEAVILMKVDGEAEPLMIVENITMITYAMMNSAKDGNGRPRTQNGKVIYPDHSTAALLWSED